MKYIVFICILLVTLSCKKGPNKENTNAQEVARTYFKAYPKAMLQSGKLLRLDSLPSNYITPRPVDVWIPENYASDKQYAVLYMHDGQMLFDSITTWNKQEWKVDEWASQLIKDGATKDFIVVAIHNIKELRWQDLFPQKAFEYLEKEEAQEINQQLNDIKQGSMLNGDNYLKFLTEELKPIIDAEFSTFSGKENTFIMGSSMGGLMSMYALCEYPNVFGAAACLSTHWPGAAPVDDNPLPEAILSYMKAHLPQANQHKIYFDYGTETLDAHYPQYAPAVSNILMEKGYTDANSKNLKFEGTDHSENSWNKRLDIPLQFLLSN